MNTTLDPLVPTKQPAIAAETAAVLRASRLFTALSQEALDEIAGSMDLVHLAGGDVLFRAGDHGDSLFVVLHGRVRVLTTDPGGQELVIREAGRGENVGEFALLTGNPRSATVEAVRDTVLARLSREAFFRLADRYPTTMVRLTRMLAAWLVDGNQKCRPSGALALTVVVVPHDPSIDAAAFCEKLARALGASSTVVSARAVDAALGSGAAQITGNDVRQDDVARWLDAQEAHHRYVIYEADVPASAWSERCLRQADRVLHLADRQAGPSLAAALDVRRTDGRRQAVREELVLLRAGGRPERTRVWLSLHRYSTHHHVCLECAPDFDRLARHLSGRAIGLVLGGGGARGFAHIGVIRALQEAGVPIDRVGGTSMGAVVAAQHAQGLDYRQMLEANRESWIRVQPQHDFTFPLIALLSGRKGTRMIDAMFGDTRIEDLQTNYYCVSTNLTRAEATVHREGLLRHWVRASISIPGIAPPFVTEGGELLVDGGVLNGIPADVMHQPDSGIVIAVDVSPRMELGLGGHQPAVPSPWQSLWQSIRRPAGASAFPTILKIMQRTAHLRTMRLADDLRRTVDLYLEPPVGKYELFGWKALDAIAETGYQSTRATIAEWRSRQPFGRTPA